MHQLTSTRNKTLILAGAVTCLFVIQLCVYFNVGDKFRESTKPDEKKSKWQSNYMQTMGNQEPAIQPRKYSEAERREFARLLADQGSAAVNPVEQKCPMYQEFRRVNFLHPTLKRRLCRNAEAYKIYPDGYPMCLLQNPFDQDMLNVVRKGSDIVGLQDMQNIRIPMFVYKGNDYVSNYVRQNSNWEAELVHWTLRFALKLPDVTFLDMGSNIGVYSLQAAKLGLPVVALDANIRNLLRLRLSLNAASRDAALVWNFIAPDQNLKYLSFLADCNVGGAGRNKADLPDTVPVMPLRSERISDLVKTKNIVMKMDIQGGETDFLRMSGRLFTDFNVAAVQMEWSPQMIRGNEFAVLTRFFTDRGYKLWRVPGFTALHLNATNSWGDIDIIWIHSDFLNMM